MLREILRRTRLRTSQAGRQASRYRKTLRYGLDLVLWSRLLSSRRAPVPLDLPAGLLDQKNVLHDPPALFVSSPGSEYKHWEEGFQAVFATLFLNLQLPDVLSEIRYAHPAPSFNGIYLWDSAFTAQVWKHWDLQVAEDINRAVVNLHEEGRLQHVVATFTESKYTQPPVLAWSLAKLVKMQPHLPHDHLREKFFEPLAAYNRWLYRNRCHENGLFYWEHPYESGIDNSPRFSSRDESEFADTRKMAAPDFCAYVILQNEAMAEMARLLHLEQPRRQYERQASELRERMNEQLWDERDGMYYDRDYSTGEFVRSSTIASFLPLWAGVPDGTQASRLLEHLEDPHAYNTLIPLPSVALNNPEFAKDMWRGPVWVNTAYGVIQGLRRYGFHETASEFSYRLCDGVFRTYKNLGKIYEFYDPDRCDLEELHRKQGNRFKHFTLGGKPVSEFVGWSGLVNTLVVDDLFGFSREGQAVQIQPRFPGHLEGLGFNLRLPQYRTAIHLELLGNGRSRCTLRDDEGTASRQLEAGEAWNLRQNPPVSSIPQDAVPDGVV